MCLCCNPEYDNRYPKINEIFIIEIKNIEIVVKYFSIERYN